MDMYSRTEILIGSEKLEKLKNSQIAVFGVGGVGGFAAEALCRAGIGEIILIDFDKIDVTNVNRQIIALNSTVGMDKVEVLKDRMCDINPHVKIRCIKKFIDENSRSEVPLENCHYVVDAIDFVRGKLSIIQRCEKEGIPVISSMGMGNKLNPLEIKIDIIKKSKVCPLARTMRKELRKRGIENTKIVFSTEEAKVKHTPPGSISFVPSVAGLIIASQVVQDIIGE